MRGASPGNQIYCSRTSTVSWYNVSGPSKQVTVAKEQMYVINDKNEVFYSPTVIEGQVAFSRIQGNLQKVSSSGNKLRQVSFDGSALFGIDLYRNNFCATEGLPYSPQFSGNYGALQNQLVVSG